MGVLVTVVAAGCGSVKATQPDAAVTADDAAVVVDVRPAACGDTIRDPGEVCYGTGILRESNDVTFDAHLADEDGDGDLDLIYLIGDQYKFYPQQGGQFAAVSINGPTTFAAHARSVDLGGMPANRVELIDAGDSGISTWRRNSANTGYELINTAANPANTVLGAFGIGKITGSALPNPVAVYSTTIVVGTYNSSLTLSLAQPRSIQGVARFLDVGLIDSDTLEDIAISTTFGVVVYRGEAGGLSQGVQTPQSAATDAVAIADIDDDNIADLVYTIAGATGTVGVMKGVGAAAFLTPVTKAVPNLGKPIDTADVDGDGRMDIIVARAQTGANALLVMLGNADGTLADPVPLPVAAPIDYIRCEADFNGDGAPDCVTTDTQTQNMVVLPSNP